MVPPQCDDEFELLMVVLMLVDQGQDSGRRGNKIVKIIVNIDCSKTTNTNTKKTSQKKKKHTQQKMMTKQKKMINMFKTQTAAKTQHTIQKHLKPTKTQTNTNFKLKKQKKKTSIHTPSRRSHEDLFLCLVCRVEER